MTKKELEQKVMEPQNEIDELKNEIDELKKILISNKIISGKIIENMNKIKTAEIIYAKWLEAFDERFKELVKNLHLDISEKLPELIKCTVCTTGNPLHKAYYAFSIRDGLAAITDANDKEIILGKTTFDTWRKIAGDLLGANFGRNEYEKFVEKFVDDVKNLITED